MPESVNDCSLDGVVDNEGLTVDVTDGDLDRDGTLEIETDLL